jgi:hypothetical protein
MRAKERGGDSAELRIRENQTSALAKKLKDAVKVRQ